MSRIDNLLILYILVRCRIRNCHYRTTFVTIGVNLKDIPKVSILHATAFRNGSSRQNSARLRAAKSRTSFLSFS